MSDIPGMVSEAELQHYVDDRLDLDRRAIVENYLRLNPEERERVTAYRAHRSALRAAFLTAQPDAVGRSDVLQVATIRRRVDAPRLQSLVAAVMVFVLGSGVGWLSHGFKGQPPSGASPSTRVLAAPYRTLSSGVAPHDTNVVVVFKPDASEAKIGQLLHSFDARFVDGPTETDGYMLHVAPEQREQFLHALQNSRDVTLAEPLDAD